MSTCNSSKMPVVVCVFGGKGNLDCLAMGHIGQKKGCHDENFAGMEDIFFIFTKGTCPSL